MQNSFFNRPLPIMLLCAISLVLVGLNIFLSLREYYFAGGNGDFMDRYWFLMMSLLNLPILAAIIMLYNLKRSGLVVFFFSIVLFFGLPALSDHDNSAFGLMAALNFVGWVILFIQFGKFRGYLTR